jgi:hypothetical protein
MSCLMPFVILSALIGIVILAVCWTLKSVNTISCMDAKIGEMTWKLPRLPLSFNLPLVFSTIFYITQASQAPNPILHKMGFYLF